MTTTINTNTFKAAIDRGYEFELCNFDSIKELEKDLMDWLNENYELLEETEDECEVHQHGHNQTLSHGDYVSTGEIVRFSDYWNEAPDFKIKHSSYLMIDTDGTPLRMVLYCLVGENDYNAPEGFIYSRREKRHVPVQAEENEENN